MSCHNERVNKSKRAKERENSSTPPTVEKSLPSLPVGAESKVYIHIYKFTCNHGKKIFFS